MGTKEESQQDACHGQHREAANPRQHLLVGPDRCRARRMAALEPEEDRGGGADDPEQRGDDRGDRQPGKQPDEEAEAPGGEAVIERFHPPSPGASRLPCSS